MVPGIRLLPVKHSQAVRRGGELTAGQRRRETMTAREKADSSSRQQRRIDSSVCAASILVPHSRNIHERIG